jgi:hypothetical protein
MPTIPHNIGFQENRQFVVKSWPKSIIRQKKVLRGFILSFSGGDAGDGALDKLSFAMDKSSGKTPGRPEGTTFFCRHPNYRP